MADDNSTLDTTKSIISNIPIAGTIGTGLISLYELLSSKKKLNDLNSQAPPTYAETPEMAASRARADYLSNFGFSPAEKAGFRKNVSEDINAKTQKALDLGGGSLSKVIGGIGKIDESAAESKFATSDAALHRQNIHYADKFSQQLQALSDKNITQQERERIMAEQALGTAAQTGLAGIGTVGNYLGTALGSGTKGTNTTPNDYASLLAAYNALKSQTQGGGSPPNPF